MAKTFRIRDPVHNFVYLREKEVKLVGTQIFQRLRRIRQLALANLVYPGALHTRFDHSLGVCYVAGMMAEQLGLNEDEVELVRLAALLHDLGHGPFSHVSEKALDRYANRTTLPENQKQHKIHELITGHLIRTNKEILRILGEDMADTIAKLLAEGHGQRALRAIVSGPLDADKQDYLLRDSRFCGVAYGVFDLLHRSFVLGGPNGDKDLMIDPDGKHAVEQFVLAKYYMTANVYRHQVRLITDQMLTRAIALGIDVDHQADLHRLYAFDLAKADEFVQNYAAWDDDRFLLTFVAEDNTGLCAEMIRRLRNRRLFKQVFSEQLSEFRPEVSEALLNLERPEFSAWRTTLETEVATILHQQTHPRVEPHFVIIHAFNIKSDRTTSRDEDQTILVVRDPGPRSFEQESALFKSIDESFSEAYIEVYAPVSWATVAERQRLRQSVKRPIRDMIESTCPKISQGGEQ
jgi:hypothetical protein